MSYFAFRRDSDGKIVVTDQDAFEVVEMIVNQLMFLNAKFEEAFETGIEEDDIDDIER
jgi:hypothetical protein|tara:strand:- start:2386 stop:2559 length:174 start_codon:yes stop_codon:yes gene_type:complete